MPASTILVVDDSPTELRLVMAPLQGKGYRVVTATNGEEAVEKALSEKPNLIVMDVIMPKKNGFQVCRQLKTTPETKDIPILLVTSKNQESDRFWGLKQGANDYLSKPFNDQALLDSVAKLL